MLPLQEVLLLLIYFCITWLLALLASSVFYARWHYGSLERSGLPAVIKPYFLGGSDPFFYKTVCCDEDTKRVRKYGRVFGMYEGRAPQVFIADPDLIRSILVKDFDHFHNKRVLDYGHPLINEMMDVLPYEKWKLVRPYLSPQLTTGKIKGMSYQMLDAIRNWVDKLRDKMENEQEDYQFSPKKAFTALTTDVIARTAFGTKINTFDNPDNVFAQNVRKLAFDDGEANILFTLTFTFPFISSLEPFLSPQVLSFFENLLQGILKRRRESPERIGDFVDAMNEMWEKVESDEKFRNAGITRNTVLSQAMFFLLAGFETTSMTLSIMSFLLSQNPDKMEKLLAEIDAYYDRNSGLLQHETLGELVYTEAVMKETLRMHPPLIRIERVCEKEWFHPETGVRIGKGVTVQIPCFAVHYDPEFYENPQEFRPERFLPGEREKLNPYAFLPFGQGPHNCIGMRFAKEEIQLTMASLLREFRFQGVPGEVLRIKKGRLFINNYENFGVRLVKRIKA